VIRATHLLFAVSLLASVSAEVSGKDSKDDWQFTDIEGKLHTPFDDSTTRGVVLVFISTDCPIANSYQPLLRRLDEQHKGKGVRFFQVHPHSQTSAEDARKHASQFRIKSPILIDAEQSLAKRVGATVTPEAFVFLRGGNSPIYQGRIDNRYAGYGKKRRVATSNDLADVLDRLVAGRPLKRSKTESIGCHITFEQDEAAAGAKQKTKRIGYEILQIKFPNEIIAWASKDVTREQFDAIKLPLGWFKNQPREVEMDGARFLNSPGLEEGSFSRAEHFGHEWLHVATVKMAGRKRLDSKGLLVGSAVVKDHIAKFDEGRTLKLLISPSGEVFPRITRDANRTREKPTLPEKWRLIEHTLDRPMEFKLTGETTVIRADNQDSFQGPVKFSLDKSQPQQATPSPDQASLLFQLFDRDGDKKISRDEAKGNLKDNFAFVDSNADGVVDLNEFIEARKLASAEPSYGTRNDKQWARMRSLSPDEDREFLMVNLIKYRAKARYADGRKTDLTGEQANALYAPIKFIGQIGARVDYVGRVNDQIGNRNPGWDEIGIVRYPSRAKFFEMVTNPEFQKRAVHKDAGLEVSQVLLTESVPWQLSGAKRVADESDAFTLAQLLKFREAAAYADGTGVKRKQTGKEAMDAFDVATESILRDVGARRMLKTSVEGALIGDGRTWDEFRMLHFPSGA